MVCATSKGSDQLVCLSLEYSMTVKLLTAHHLEFPSLKEGCTGSSESTLIKMPHCWKSHVTAQILLIDDFNHYINLYLIIWCIAKKYWADNDGLNFRFGIKGKIDLTVETCLKKEKTTKILPLELKTGKPSFSVEHKGQVIIYTFLASFED